MVLVVVEWARRTFVFAPRVCGGFRKSQIQVAGDGAAVDIPLSEAALNMITTQRLLQLCFSPTDLRLFRK
jgi:hypothetical protein